MHFQLHKSLKHDCIELGHFQLCRVLLMDDNQFPWFILVPEIAGITEIFQLRKAQQIQLIEESSYLAEQLQFIYKPDKLNIAAIGNLVPQLHIHHVVRYKTDKLWPAPVWGKLPSQPYSKLELEQARLLIGQRLEWLQT